MQTGVCTRHYTKVHQDPISTPQVSVLVENDGFSEVGAGLLDPLTGAEQAEESLLRKLFTESLGPGQ